MTDRILMDDELHDDLPAVAAPQAARRRLALVLGLSLATMAGLLSLPALAEGPPHGRPEPPRREAQRHDERRYEEHYRRPDIYTSAPPVVVAPPSYYQQPGVSLNFNFPFIR